MCRGGDGGMVENVGWLGAVDKTVNKAECKVEGYNRLNPDRLIIEDMHSR